MPPREDEIDRRFDDYFEQDSHAIYTSQAKLQLSTMTDREIAEETLYHLRRIDAKLHLSGEDS